MNSSIGGPDPTAFSSRLGTFAASMHTTPPQITDATAQPATFGERLAALLASLRRRQQAQDTFKANHFIMAD